MLQFWYVQFNNNDNNSAYKKKNTIALTGTVADGSVPSWSIIYWALKQKMTKF